MVGSDPATGIEMEPERRTASGEEPRARQYRAWQALFLSVFSPAVYRDAALSWRGYGFAYLALLVVVSWVPPTAALQVRLLGAGSELADAVAPITSLTIADGVLEADVEQPWEAEVRGVRIVLDTTGATRPSSAGAAVYVGRKAVVVRSGPEPQVFEYDTFGDMELDGASLGRTVRLISYLGPAAVFVAGVCASLLWRGLFGLLYGGVLKVAARVDFASGLRLGLLAVTPAVLLDTLWVTAGWTPPAWRVVGILLVWAYLAFAAVAVRSGRD